MILPYACENYKPKAKNSPLLRLYWFPIATFKHPISPFSSHPTVLQNLQAFRPNPIPVLDIKCMRVSTTSQIPSYLQTTPSILSTLKKHNILNYFEYESSSITSSLISQQYKLPNTSQNQKTLTGTLTRKVKYTSTEDLHVKFFKMFVRRGNLDKILKIFTLVFSNVLTFRAKSVFPTNQHINFVNTTWIHSFSTKNYLLKGPGAAEKPEASANQALKTVLKDYQPSFSFKVQKVDKQVQKYSRGKSGKYSLTWSYLPPKRRWLVVLQWLKKDFIFQKNSTLHGRIHQGIATLLGSPNETSLAHTRRFVHNFIFKKFRKVLVNLVKYKL